MLKRVTEQQLIRSAIALAKSTRRKIVEAGLDMSDYNAIAALFDVSVVFDDLPAGKDGSYLKDQRKIVLNKRVRNQERRNFSFFHELMHVQIEDDPDLLSDFADAYRRSDEETMERMCDAGAAELLIPAQEVRAMMRTKGFSAALIPDLCQQFQASSLAVAFQLINLAGHKCHLVIAEPSSNGRSPAAELTIVYTARSSAEEKYSIARGQTLPERSLLSEVWQLGEGRSKQADDCIPFASRTEWVVPCDAFRFRGKVFAFFNVEPAISTKQLTLL